jgi:hypothetical protein
LGTFITAFPGGIPGVLFDVGLTGSTDIPGGRSFALLLLKFELSTITFAFVFVFELVAELHAERAAIRQAALTKNILDI